MEELDGSKEHDFIELIKSTIIAGKKAVIELLKVAEKPLIEELSMTSDEELSADRLTRATQAKKMAIMDAFEITKKCQEEQNLLDAIFNPEQKLPTSFTSNRAKSLK